MLRPGVWVTFFVTVACLFSYITPISGSFSSSSSSELEEEHFSGVLLVQGEEDGTLSCPVGCICTGTEVDCSDLKFWTLPLDIGLFTTVLDLSQNHIQHLADFSFARYHHLEELNLASNNVVNLSTNVFAGIGKLRVLNLRDNNLTSIPWHAFHELHFLHELHLGDNRIHVIYKGDFYGLKMLKTLTLEGNGIQTVPSDSLRVLTNLEILSLSKNNISCIENGSFEHLNNLKGLSLSNNEINRVESKAFDGLFSLEVLELQHNRLDVIPNAISSLIAAQKISLSFNHIRHVSNSIFAHNPMLIHADILGNPVMMVEHYVFTNLTRLKILIIPEAKELTRFPDLNGTTSLEFLRIDRARIRHVPSDLCGISHNLKTLDLKSNSLLEVPPLEECAELRQLQLSGNDIRSLEGGLFENQNLLHDLLLSNNLIDSLPADAFVGLHKLEILNLVGNQIASIHPDAFLPLKQLVYLNLAENRFPQLPNDGLEHVRQLLAFNNPFLRDFPPPSSFPHVHTLKLAYAYHCCQFSPSGRDLGGRSGFPVDLQETVLWLPKDKVDLSLWAGNSSDIWPAYQNLTHKFGDLAEDLWGSLSPDYVYPSNLPQVVEDYFDETKSNDYHRPGHSISCTPQPGPFMPCEDLFDFWTLRCGIWIVFLLAMLGNGTVVFVLIFSRTKMDVPRFLVCNLACADFCMGVYLGFLAVVDASTLGHFKIHALQWQFSGACQLAGFLGVLSSELSVFTLAVITLERNYAITHAMHLNKRLSLKHAAYIMSCGWTFATVTAGLPLVGISDYRKFAICLPFDIEGPWALTYVVFLMAVNGVAFLILMGCYLKMYCAIRGSQAWNSNDSRIAKRMALLVFTDFICWAPIAFFSLTAAFGLQLVSLEEAKVFTIFVLPLNSCANPFLYAILTKQFKKDCVLICKAIEESRVTRGIGRCRHSSNFSNRQTPANTNSAVDRNSNNGQVACSCSRGSSDGVGGVRIPVHHGGVAGGNLNATGTPSDAEFRRRRWRVFKRRVLFCVGGGDSEPNLSSEYTYAIAEIQKNQQKHSRNLSVSSDNFSSSRSDSWRQKSIPLRLIEKGRRNSWTITRKPSQDSNLSSSRNDSSATTPSTSTWRVSRSSVSSDMSSGNMGQRTTATNLRTSGGASSSVQCPASCTVGVGSSSNDGQSAPTVRFSLPKSCGTEVDPESILLTSARPRAKLRRQSAVNEDTCGSPSRPTPIEDKFSCLYSRLSEVAREEDEEGADCRKSEVFGGGVGSGGGYSSLSSADRLRYAASRHAAGRNLMDYGSRSGPTGFARGELFLPRKLSTISSNSCSLNQDTWSLTTGGQANSSSLTPSATLTRDRSSESDLERPSSMTNVAVEGPVESDHRRTLSDASFYHRRLSVPIGSSRGTDVCKLSQSDYVIDAGSRPRWDGFPRSVLPSEDTKRLLSNYRHSGIVEIEAGVVCSEEDRSQPPPPYLEDDV